MSRPAAPMIVKITEREPALFFAQGISNQISVNAYDGEWADPSGQKPKLIFFCFRPECLEIMPQLTYPEKSFTPPGKGVSAGFCQEIIPFSRSACVAWTLFGYSERMVSRCSRARWVFPASM